MKINLAENLLRFGVKNLDSNLLSKYLQEQTTVPANIYGKLAATTTIAQLPKIMQTYNPQSGYVSITDGNPWLATQRANALKAFLTTQAQQTLKIPVDANSIIITETKVQGTGDANQYTLGKLKAKLTKPPQIQGQYPYTILYNFYDVNGVPYIVITKRGMGTPEELATQTDLKQMQTKMPKDSILVKQSAGLANAQSPVDFNYGILVPINTGYTAKKAGRLYFDNIQQYDAMKKFIAAYTDITDATGQAKETGDLKGRRTLQTNFTSEKGGGGNYIFGSLGSGRNVSIIAGPGSGTNVTIKRMEPSKIGTIPGDVAAGNEEKWVEIGSFKLDSSTFPDNLITIDTTKYEMIINTIREKILELADQGYEPVSLAADIQGFASTDPANNRCPRGKKPDHAWGGSVTPDKWITLQ